MAGRYKDIPPNVQKRLEALFGISYQEWLHVRRIIDDSFDNKKAGAEKGFKLESEKDVHNKIFLQY